MRAATPEKDQSYVLFNLTQEQLSRAQFPIGELTKAQVREIARSLGLATAEKPDSQDVCFVRDRNKNGFLRRELQIGDAPGPIIDVEGNLLGTHQGLLGYTIGQREGIGLAIGKPLYVVAIDQPGNRLVVGEREDLMSRTLIAERVNWVSIAPPTEPLRAWAKIRSRHEPAPAMITPVVAGGAGTLARGRPGEREGPRDSGPEPGPATVDVAFDEPQAGRLRRPALPSATPLVGGVPASVASSAIVEFDNPQQAITPGQAVVFYDGDLVLGGGWIAA